MSLSQWRNYPSHVSLIIPDNELYVIERIGQLIIERRQDNRIHFLWIIVVDCKPIEQWSDHEPICDFLDISQKHN